MLWNILTNDILNLINVGEAADMGCIDVIELVVVRKHLVDVELYETISLANV